MPRDSFRYSSPPATPPAAPLDNPLDTLAKEVVCPHRAGSEEDERLPAFEKQMRDFMGDESDPLVRELRRQAFLVETLALQRLKEAEKPYDWLCQSPSEAARDRNFLQAMTLMKLYQSQVEAVRRWKALPEGSTFNQVFVQQGETQNGENSGGSAIRCEAEVLGPEPGHEGEPEREEARMLYEGETSGETELLEVGSGVSEDA